MFYTSSRPPAPHSATLPNGLYLLLRSPPSYHYLTTLLPRHPSLFFLFPFRFSFQTEEHVNFIRKQTAPPNQRSSSLTSRRPIRRPIKVSLGAAALGSAQTLPMPGDASTAYHPSPGRVLFVTVSAYCMGSSRRSVRYDGQKDNCTARSKMGWRRVTFPLGVIYLHVCVGTEGFIIIHGPAITFGTCVEVETLNLYEFPFRPREIDYNYV